MLSNLIQGKLYYPWTVYLNLNIIIENSEKDVYPHRVYLCVGDNKDCILLDSEWFTPALFSL